LPQNIDFTKNHTFYFSANVVRISERYCIDFKETLNDLRSIDFNFAAVVAIVYGLLGGFLARNLYITQDFW